MRGRDADRGLRNGGEQPLDAEGASLATPGNVSLRAEVSSPLSAERNSAFAIFAESNPLTRRVRRLRRPETTQRAPWNRAHDSP
jgi:hypothetical protein